MAQQGGPGMSVIPTFVCYAAAHQVGADSCLLSFAVALFFAIARSTIVLWRDTPSMCPTVATEEEAPRIVFVTISVAVDPRR